MTTPRDPDRLLADYLADGMGILPERVVDAVLAEVHQTSQRTVFGPRRTPLMSSPFKFLLVAAAAVAIAIVGFNVLLPGNGAQTGGPAVVSPSPSAPPAASPSSQRERMTVSGTELDASPMGFTIVPPDGWSVIDGSQLFPDTSGDDTMAFVTVIDNTFSDPCASTLHSPKVGSTVDDVATALGEIDGTTASAPIQTTLGGYEATFVELTFSDPPACDLRTFYLWQDTPGSYRWPQSVDETLGAWIVDVGGTPVVVATRTYPETSDETTTEMQQALDSIVFDAAS